MKRIDYLKVARPDWNLKKRYFKVDLSRNVNFDKKIHTKVKKIISKNKRSILNYGEPVEVYKSISNYYKIPISNLSIGFGATDIINRLLKILDVRKVYIVKPSFEATEVYCKINNIKPIIIDRKNIYSIKRKNSAIYIVNPNGNDGTSIKIDNKIFQMYKYVIIDEVYGEFYPRNSLLNKKHKQLIIIKSLSKSLGLAGIRVGFCKSSAVLTKKIQAVRLSQVCNSFASLIVPKIIGSTKEFVKRMNTSKRYLEKKYSCANSFSNYVLFKKSNNLTKKCGFKKVNGFFRMALADIQTLKSNE
tara:strand:- start:4474 stop:5379 length:906 start_codon:yes stop_codon:yes gene_type:complete